MVNAQEWLDQNYPLKNRKKVKKLDINTKKLEGSLNLSGFANLKELDCSNNNLTSLDISDCNKFVKLTCDNEQYNHKLIEKLKGEIKNKQTEIDKKKLV